MRKKMLWNLGCLLLILLTQFAYLGIFCTMCYLMHEIKMPPWKLLDLPLFACL
uniref:Phosphatidic acid phosphatase family protein n=1 Tax=Rhizophora mucronata TaxID=61149 RepID=A0A2P2L650_RHIMU